MKTYNIATGKSRIDRQWKNEQVTWDEFANILKETKRTEETYEEYRKASRVKQGDIKDVGGFVAGYIKDGRRTANNIKSRSMLTLDIDYAPTTFWLDYVLNHNYKSILYSTHSHSEDTPRYRLIMPLDRDVTPDEYTAISRSIANKINIELFDDTTHQANRLMYYPSTSKDADYIFETQDGEEVSADDILKEYDGWEDTAKWPTSTREGQIIKRASKQQDPTEKDGIIGAFCRTYTIKEAIATFLSDVYTPTADPNRYTYAKGSSQGGLVIYDDKLAYSNHGTDPASQQTCNAFDLVRLHKYGDLDEDAKDNTPTNRLKSYQAMIKKAGEDKETMQTIAEDEIDKNFDYEMAEEEKQETAKWMAKLSRNKKTKKVESTIENAVMVLENDKKLKDVYAYDTFANRAIATRDLPWREVDEHTKDIKDSDDNEIRFYMEKYYDITSANKIEDAVVHITHKNNYNPVKEYLEGVEWDGEERLDTALVNYLGADDNEYTRAVTRKTLTAAVARIYEPGIKFDYMLTLVGAQGIGKSTLFAKLAMDWFSDSITNPGTKDAYEQLQGVWISEIAELAALKGAEVETIKSFISKTHDRYRVAYGRRAENFARQGILVGSTNESTFLRDQTGNRRFWTVEVYEPKESIHDALTQEIVDQIWAEAKVRYEEGEELFLTRELEKRAGEYQNLFTERDEKEELIDTYLETLIPEDWAEYTTEARRNYYENLDEKEEGVLRDRVCALEIAVELFGQSRDTNNRELLKDIHAILRRHNGWDYDQKTMHFGGIYGKQKAYTRNKD